MKNSVTPQLETAISRIVQNLQSVAYGEVSATWKIHNSRIVSITHSVTETTVDRAEENMKTGHPP
jgi:hypothetical protein